jgi:hypothetical protein
MMSAFDSDHQAATSYLTWIWAVIKAEKGDSDWLIERLRSTNLFEPLRSTNLSRAVGRLIADFLARYQFSTRRLGGRQNTSNPFSTS